MPTPYHGLLGLLRGDPADVARLALERCGLSAEQVERWVCHLGAPAEPQPDDPSQGWERVVGRAEGLAATLGSGLVRPVDFLLALLWDPWVWPFVYWNLGVRPEQVLEALPAEVALPHSPLPQPQGPVGMAGTQRLVCPRPLLSAVLRILDERSLARGVAYGFTLPDDGTAWIVADNQVPLEGVIDQARAETPHG